MGWIKQIPPMKAIRKWLYDRNDASHNVNWTPYVPWYTAEAEENHPKSITIQSETITRQRQKKLYVKGNFYGHCAYGSQFSFNIYLDHDGTSTSIKSGSWGSYQTANVTIDEEVDITTITNYSIRVTLYARSGSTGNPAISEIHLTQVYSE